MMRSVLHDPVSGIGKPERLKHFGEGYYSRRISLEHRCVYRVDSKHSRVVFVSFRFHYET